MKIKRRAKLLPSARDNRRYILISGSQKNKQEVEKALLDYIGILGMAKSAFLFLDSDKLIASCKRESLEEVRASLAFGKFRIEKVSGTIAGLGR